MNILLDAYDAQYGFGTGILTYLKNLYNILNKMHEVSLQYGLKNIDKELIKETFLQDLSRHMKPSKISRIKQCLCLHKYFDIYLDENDIQLLGDSARIVSKHICNITGLYDYAPFYFKLTNKFYTMKNRHNFSIYHKPCPIPISLKDAINITTIHDLIPLDFPSSTNINTTAYYKNIKSTIKYSDYIITVSQYSKKKIIERFAMDENKIKIIYNTSTLKNEVCGVASDWFINKIETNFKLKYKEYMLFYGSIEPKKNVRRLIDAVLMSKTKMPLVIVSSFGWSNNDIYDLINKNPEKIIHINYLSYKDLAYLIKGACACVFPSLYEGFGLPVLEAMQLKCPVITSNVTSLPEVGGDAVHYVNPYDTADIAVAIDTVSNSKDYQKELIEKGCEQSKKFDPAKIEKATLDFYSAIL